MTDLCLISRFIRLTRYAGIRFNRPLITCTAWNNGIWQRICWTNHKRLSRTDFIGLSRYHWSGIDSHLNLERCARTISIRNIFSRGYCISYCLRYTRIICKGLTYTILRRRFIRLTRYAGIRFNSPCVGCVYNKAASVCWNFIKTVSRTNRGYNRIGYGWKRGFTIRKRKIC